MKVLAIVGPTASGKTALAVELAHRLGSQILSADSRQVYRGLDLGTGKDLEEYHQVDPPVPVHLIDLVDADEVYTLARYLDDFQEVIRRLAAREPFCSGVPAVMCGGSGLYVEAALRDFNVPRVPPNPELRRELEVLESAVLLARLERLAPEIAASIDRSTKRRIIRGLERALAADTPPPTPQAPLPRLEPMVVVIDPDLEGLQGRIAARLSQRVAAGLIEEVQGLLDHGIPLERLQGLGLEYREIGEALAGMRPLEQGLERLEREIVRFAKRQRTWFRGMPRRGLATTTVPRADADEVWPLLLAAGWTA